MQVWLASSGWSRSGTSMYTYAHRVLHALSTAGVMANPLAVAQPSAGAHGGVIRPLIDSYFRKYPRSGDGLIHDVDFVGARRGVDVATLHDLAPYHYPSGRRWSWTGLDRIHMTVRRARRIVAVSDGTRKDVVRFMGPSVADKVRVVHTPFEPVSVGRLDPEYDALWVGTVAPRKQMWLLLRLIDRVPMTRIAVRWRSWPTRPDLNEPVRAALRGAENAVSIEEQLSENELDRLYRKSSCLISTSAIEGFQAPIIEAYLRGTRVVVPDSDTVPAGRLLADSPGVHFYRSGDVVDLERAVHEAVQSGPFYVSARIRDVLSPERVGRELRAVYEEIA